jgi:hypothetical protein
MEGIKLKNRYVISLSINKYKLENDMDRETLKNGSHSLFLHFSANQKKARLIGYIILIMTELRNYFHSFP